MEQNNQNYFIYMHKNKINNKIYIGITGELSPEIRWQKGYSHNKHFSSAIKKYGWDNFQHIILFQKLNKFQAEEKEKELIEFYNSDNPNYGYNLTSGGGLGVCKHNDYSKRLMSINTSGEKNPMFGKHHSEETKNKIRKKLQSHPRTSKKILCVELNQIFNSLREAERITGINHSNISQAAKTNGNQKTAGGFHWSYVEKEKSK